MRGRAGVTAAAVAALSCALLVAGFGLTRGDQPPPSGGATIGPAARESPVSDALPRSDVPPASQPLGLKWSRAQPETLDFVAEAGGGSTFVEVLWCEVEPEPGTYRWGGLDAVVRDARLLGHEPMLKLRAGQCWGTTPASSELRDPTENATKEASTPPIDMAAYLAFVRATVQRYATLGIDVYAVENEPDTTNHWAASVEEYRSIAVQVASAIHAAQPGAHVLDGGPSSTAYGVALAAAQIEQSPTDALATYRSYYARRLAGSASRFPDVQSVEELRAVLATDDARRAAEAVRTAVDLANSGVTDGYQLHFYEEAEQLPAVLQLVQSQLHGSVPIEAWEIGVAWPGDTYDERVHATEVFRIVGLLLQAGVSPIVHLPVAYSEAPGKTQVFRGLTEPDGSLLPAGNGWVELTGAVAGLDGSGVLPVGSGLSGATWRVGVSQAALVWATGSPVELDAADVGRVVDATGATLPGPPVVGSEPVLVIGSAGGDLVRAVSGR